MDTVRIKSKYGEITITTSLYLLDDFSEAFALASIKLREMDCHITADRYEEIAELFTEAYLKVAYGEPEKISDNPYQE